MSRPQLAINIVFQAPWHIRRPLVFRYLDKQYVDAFFADGSLRLSSFAAFATHSDEERNDAAEGAGVLVNTDPTGEGQTFMAAIGQGHSAYVLCSSLVHDDELARAFTTDSGFRINDPTQFAGAVARMLPGFRGGLEGPCTYRDARTVHRSMPGIDMAALGDDSNRLGTLMATSQEMAGDDLFFLKPRKYQHQSEYRLIWVVDAAQPFIQIKCPQAREFCTCFDDESF